MNLYGNLQSDSKTFLLQNEINKIGRNPLTNNIIINHQSISKDHAIIEFNKAYTAFISDMHSSNGTFVNGTKISPNTKHKLTQNDIIRFGKDMTCYKFNSFIPSQSLPLNDNNGNSVVNSNNTISALSTNHLQQSALPLSFAQLNDEYNKLNAKHNALLQYASSLQKKNDFLEFTLKERDMKIKELESASSNMQLLNEKDAMIKLLQNENVFYNNELQKIKTCFNSDGATIHKLDSIVHEYLTEISNLRRINEEYKTQFMQCDRKWSELLKLNDTLKIQIEVLNKQWSEDNDKYMTLLEINDRKLNEALHQIPGCYDRFNVNKEQAARFLVSQVDMFLNEKKNLMYENSLLNKRNAELMYENEKLKDEICVISSKNCDYNVKMLQERNAELEDVIINLRTANEVEKKIDYENMLKRLNQDVANKENAIIVLKEKLAQSMHNSNLFFDEKEVVNSISMALKSRDEEIKQLKTKLSLSGFDDLHSNNNNNKSNLTRSGMDVNKSIQMN